MEKYTIEVCPGNLDICFFGLDLTQDEIDTVTSFLSVPSSVEVAGIWAD